MGKVDAAVCSVQAAFRAIISGSVDSSSNDKPVFSLLRLL